MILTLINQKMPIYKDCTLFELLMVSSAVLIVGGTFLSFFTWLIFGYVAIGMAITLLSFVHVSRFILSILQKLKYGKPYGYYSHLLLKAIASHSWTHQFWQAPWIMRQGHWSVMRRY